MIIIKMTMADISVPQVIWWAEAQKIRVFAVQEGAPVEVSLTESDQKVIQETFSGQDLETVSIFTAFLKKRYDCIIEYEKAQAMIDADQRKGYYNASNGRKFSENVMAL